MFLRRAGLCLGLWSILAVRAFAQVSDSSPARERAASLPATSDWFLSTGAWQSDPQLYVREFGRGTELVVLLHGGWGGEHSGLIDAVRPLEGKYRFVLYDQRGSLRSPAPESTITFDRHVEDLELLRRELDVEQVTVVGHSMGAILASAYATKYPQRVKRLVLVSPAQLKRPLSDDDQTIVKAQSARVEAFVERPDVGRELAKYGLDRTDRPLTSREETAKFRIALYRRMLYDVAKWPSLMGGRALYKGLVGELTSRTYPPSWDYVEEFGRRDYPVGLIVGDHDFVDFGAELATRWTRGAPRISLTVLPKAGHLPWIDQPDALAAALDRHLAARR